MSNGKVMIVHLIVGLIEKTQMIVLKWVNMNRMNRLVEILALKLTCLFMQQNRYEIYIACWYF